MRLIVILAFGLGLASIAIAGFSMGTNLGGDLSYFSHGSPNLTTTDGEPSYSPKEELIRDSLQLAKDVLAFKESQGTTSGSGTTLGDVVGQFETLVDENRFCESSDQSTARDQSWAETQVGPNPYAGYSEFIWEYSQGDSPGVNINYELMPCPTSSGPFSSSDKAITASTLMHESWHALTNQRGPDGKHDETAANEFEAEFLCCMKEFFEDQLPTGTPEGDADIQDAIGAICGHLNGVVGHRLCKLGSPPPTCAGCSPIAAVLWLIFNLPDFDSITPRDPISESQYEASTGSFRTNIGRFHFMLAPADGDLIVTRYSGASVDSWILDIPALHNGGFVPKKMAATHDKKIVLAGKNSTTGNGMVVLANVAIVSDSPVIQFTTVVDSPTLGEITDIDDISPANNCFAAFDYTNARIVYIDRFTGAITELVSHTTHPDLLDFAGLTAGVSRDEETGEYAGVTFFVHQSQSSTGIGNYKQLIVADKGANGSVDNTLLLPGQ